MKIGDLTRKARFCANGNETDPPKESTFSTVVSRDSVRLFFLLVALNDLDILFADTQNAYLSAPVKEKLLHHCRKRVWANDGRTTCANSESIIWIKVQW